MPKRSEPGWTDAERAAFRELRERATPIDPQRPGRKPFAALRDVARSDPDRAARIDAAKREALANLEDWATTDRIRRDRAVESDDNAPLQQGADALDASLDEEPGHPPPSAG